MERGINLLFFKKKKERKNRKRKKQYVGCWSYWGDSRIAFSFDGISRKYVGAENAWNDAGIYDYKIARLYFFF